MEFPQRLRNRSLRGFRLVVIVWEIRSYSHASDETSALKPLVTIRIPQNQSSIGLTGRCIPMKLCAYSAGSSDRCLFPGPSPAGSLGLSLPGHPERYRF
jgi:hypothetical protein